PEPAPGEIGFDIVQDQGARKADTATASIASSAVDLPVAAIDEIVRRVVNEITDSVIREIAWEVVPDCVERIVEKLSREAMAKRA
ncbi:MAG TPA: hypothetical protein VJX67_20805, partial [Blastocatellia bacterium]|nr:hypothetical protein [Blastocatellia bacterium]